MAGRLAQILDHWHLRSVQARWARAADAAAETEPFELRALRAEGRALRRQIDRVIHAADQRLALPAPGAGVPRPPLGIDWAWRADAWRGPLPSPGSVAAEPRTEVSDDLTLHHDCPLGEVAVRQLRNHDAADRAPHGLAVEVFGFRGSFLSLDLRLPAAGITGLKARHLVRVDAVIDSDRPLRGFARLNCSQGHNVTQMVRALPDEGREAMVDFDLASGGLGDAPIEGAWLDLIFNDVANARIVLRDLVLSRRPRAEF
ncbi:MAG: DUF6478 family protein [Tabrizicola sp.]